MDTADLGIEVAWSGLLILMLEKLYWFHNTGAIDVKNGWVCTWGKIIFNNAGIDFLF